MRSLGLAFSGSLNNRYSHQTQQLFGFFHHCAAQARGHRRFGIRFREIARFKRLSVLSLVPFFDAPPAVDLGGLERRRFPVKNENQLYLIVSDKPCNTIKESRKM